MITDKQFEDSFTTAGGWFVAVYYETVADWRDEKSKLVDKIFADGTDSKRTGTTTRVSSLQRIIDNERSIDALEKIAASERIKKQNPTAVVEAARILLERFHR